MTRSTLALFRLDLTAAWHYHPLVFYLFIAVPVMIYLYLRDKDVFSKRLLIFSAVLMLAVYLYRMLILHSPVLVFAPKNGIFLRSILGIADLFQ